MEYSRKRKMNIFHYSSQRRAFYSLHVGYGSPMHVSYIEGMSRKNSVRTENRTNIFIFSISNVKLTLWKLWFRLWISFFFVHLE